MTKAEFIEKVSSEADISKADAGKALNAVTDTISKALKRATVLHLLDLVLSV